MILTCGRLSKQKNHRLLIKALSKIRNDINGKLVIIGEGEERTNLEKYISQERLTDHVFLLGWVENPFPYMTICDVFALSSDYEGLGNVLVEALMCGTPIVSTDCPHGPREILENGRYGRLVPCGDTNLMAGAIMGTFTSQIDRSQLVKRASAFSIDKLGEQYTSLIEELCFHQSNQPRAAGIPSFEETKK